MYIEGGMLACSVLEWCLHACSTNPFWNESSASSARDKGPLRGPLNPIRRVAGAQPIFALPSHALGQKGPPHT